MSISSLRLSSSPQTFLRSAAVGIVALTLGVLTAFAQEWLPTQLHSLANSAASWALIAFALSFLATTAPMSAIFGCVSLLGMELGYVLGSGVRGDPSSDAWVAFWSLSALVAGPLFGLAAHWVKTRRDLRAGVAIGAVSGVVIGEGIYGLTQIANTTYPPYWWGQILAGSALLGFVVWRRLQGVRAIAIAMAVAALAAVSFVFIYGQGPLAFAGS